MGRPFFGSIPRSWNFFMSFHIVRYVWHLYVSYSTYKMLNAIASILMEVNRSYEYLCSSFIQTVYTPMVLNMSRKKKKQENKSLQIQLQ